MTIFKKIEMASNVAIILVASLLGVTLVKQHLFNAPPPSAPPVDSTSNDRNTTEDLSTLNVNWATNKKTLLLVLSNTCHFCRESAPFYKQLVAESHSSHMIALFPQPVEEAEKYLKTMGVNVDEVRQADFGAMNIAGTPTLILVNSDGAIIARWVGRLTSEKEREVVKNLL